MNIDLLKTDIMDLMKEMECCYRERRPENVEGLVESLFNPKVSPIIIGTSNNEWCFGIEEVKKLFLSDWDGWGNLTIDVESLTVEEIGDLGWMRVKAGLEYNFEDHDDVYENFYSFIQEVVQGNKGPLAKTGEIMWLLSHLLHTREKGNRKYIWDLNITGLLELTDGGSFKFNILQFSLPVSAAFPDVRIDTNSSDQKQYKAECEKIKRYNEEHFNSYTDLKKLIVEVFNKASQVEFNQSYEGSFLGMDGVLRQSNSFHDYLLELSSHGNEIEVLPDHLILHLREDALHFCGVGLIKREVNLEEELNKVLSKVGAHEYTGTSKDILFKIRRDLSLVLKEASQSEEALLPIRIEGLGQLVDNTFYLKSLHLSYPFNYVLEENTEESRVVIFKN